ncbi:membrane fusion protein (multidrug efflux system) [Azomonas agilis]|uniref:Membrane fusion protein (Multidrug efflux system) n=1 Tax=Azomonas agilis TaxID=116849 RepID=A0A562HZJ5_9GAMM|nr:efflux RND transporter periplasmic adaptor subunit [Azomonas agilis]TWH64209.1 membrane fusion protein (multidrug efflux system) [Azomonas agilis]
MISIPSLGRALALLALPFAVTACKEEATPAAAAPPPAPLVGIVTLKTESLALTTDLPGRTQSFRVAEVRPQVDGIVQKRLFTEGVEVTAGQQLYQIDPSMYQAALKNAQATLKNAQAGLASSRALSNRYADLVEDRAVSRQAYEDARSAMLQSSATVEQASAAVEQAQINLRYTRVMAPISGRIGRTLVTEGALVGNGQTQPMTVIYQLDPIYVDVTQPVRELLRLRRDLDEGRLEKVGENTAKVSLTLEDGSQYPLEGKLELAEVSVDQSTGSVTLRAIFPNPKRLLLPGMFVHAQLTEGVRTAAILAPQQGITRDSTGQPSAMVVNAENRVEVRRVKTSRTVGNRWLITEGLHEGDRLITEGLQFIKPGIEVRVAPATNVDMQSSVDTQGGADRPAQSG